MKTAFPARIQMRSGPNRIEFVASLIDSGEVSGSTLCDLGSRDEVLRDSLSNDIEYLGVDIYPTKRNTIFSDIEKKIETSEQYDIVTALDVLEHTNDINKALSEMLRICGGTFIINLPNELTLLYRLRLLFGRISGKFLVNLSSLDRHRWFFTLQNVERFLTQTDLRNHEIELVAFYIQGGLLSRFNRLLGMLGFHSLGAHSFMIIGRKSQ